jgi:hypothetical protein
MCRNWISGREQQMALELRPAHDPTRAYGFVGVVLSLKDLSSSIWLWYREPRTGQPNGGNGAAAAVQMVVPPEVVRSTAAAALLALGLYKLR